MATVVYINVYNSHVDRGATVTGIPREHYEVDEEGIKVGKPLPKFKCGTPIVTAYDGCVYDGDDYSLELTWIK